MDLNKLLLHDFHYKDIGIKYVSATKFLFTDTNSLVYETKADDVYEDFYESRSLFDFSN